MAWAIGQVLKSGDYVIEQILGQGGFGITYKALQVNLNRPVVIKTPNEFLHHDPEYDKYIERFKSEGQILAHLSQDPHPHIVGVIELFQEDNIYCLVMEFVPGENLFQLVKRRGALPAAEIVPCIRQIAEALIVVHQSGLVHRDAHPGNIMLRSNSKAVLIDFGIAKQIIPTTQSSTDKAAHERFAPYEQRYKGSRDPRVDIYCLAATLYYALTSQNPTNSLARKLGNERLIPPQEIIPSISNKLNEAILIGMALEAKDRPQTMQLWLEMLSNKPKIPSSNIEVPKLTLLPPANNPVNEIRRPEFYLFRLTPQRKAILKKLIRNLPLVSLMSLLLLHVFMGYRLSLHNSLFWSWVLTLALTMVGSGAFALSSFWSLALALAWVAVLVGAWVAAGYWVLAWGLTLGWALVSAETKLKKFFSKFHAFLIFTGTSSIGLVLGWMLSQFFNLVSIQAFLK
ncbi:serine/threonine protein kinase [Anabaena sp. UHCC 0451]|uniref:serine/threonine protein kinase n=1 Tax=Anabaena sp. UHCC 0451 TaxID=2055235 RepID=UPI002B21701D|nr:protein kinase [Anabaena sp. UHCC 0451]MEA5579119.1 protein kinase [Anabaena sp. UHCC 0451]